MAQGNINGKEKEDIIVSPTEPTGASRKKIWIQKGKNLFDGNITNGYGLSNDGTMYSSTKRSISGFISITANLSYCFSGATFKTICLYDKDQKIISSLDGSLVCVFATPGNAKYVRFALDNTIDYKNLQIEVGKKATKYEAYIKNNIYTKNKDDVYEDFFQGKCLSTHDFDDQYKAKLDGLADGANKTITKTATAKTHTNYPNDNAKVPDMAFMAFWNGAFNTDNDSNLTYCYQGEIQAKPTILYNNVAGSAGTIMLSQSVNNFIKLKIFAVREGTTADSKEYTSTEVYGPNGKNVGLHINHATDNMLQFYGTRVNINGTAITHIKGNYMGANKTLGIESYSNNEHLKIVAVLGYK